VRSSDRCSSDRCVCARSRIASESPRRDAIANEAEVDAIRRPQRHRVELDARVHDAGRVERERLQLGIVRRRGDEHAALEQRLEHRHREGGALVRVGAGADLVEEREVPPFGLRERRDDVP
jgi:hypothetical protein